MIDTDLLPPILQDIVELIGLQPTMRLVETYGGVRLYVPKLELEDDHPLIRQIGREAAEKLQAMYGGEPHFDIPKAERALRAVRDARIRHLRSAGASTRTLALDNGLTERQIRTICGELEDDRQVGLF
jgi:Mor family transcriptional regulator